MVSHTRNEASPTDDGEGVSVGTGSSQHGPGVREEQREAARPATAERQQRLVGYPADLGQRDGGALKRAKKRSLSGSNRDCTHLTGQPAPRQHRSLAVHHPTQVFSSGLLLEVAVGGATSLLLQRHHGADTRVHLPRQSGRTRDFYL